MLFYREIRECFAELNEEQKCRAIVLSGAGRLFSSGLDFSDMGALMSAFQGDDDVARKFKKMLAFIKPYQESFTALEKVESFTHRGYWIGLILFCNLYFYSVPNQLLLLFILHVSGVVWILSLLQILDIVLVTLGFK